MAQFPSISIFLLLPLLFQFYTVESGLQLNYYSKSCPKAEEIIKEQVTNIFQQRKYSALSWLRNLFHDCAVKSCDASLLLDTANGVESEKETSRNFFMRNFNYLNTIKDAVETKCPGTVSCADIVALTARDGLVLLGGPYVQLKTGRKDSKESYKSQVEKFIPRHNDSISGVLSTFKSMGIDTEGTVALLGAHSMGRVHCVNIVHRLYPTVDKTMDPAYADYLKGRCPSPQPDPKDVEYSRFDLVTPLVLDNLYYKNILKHRGLLIVDQELASDPRTYPFVVKMANDNKYFHEQFSRALLILSENNPLTGNDGEIRKDCRFVNK